MANVDTNTLCQEETDLILENTTDSTKKFSETDIFNMLEFLIDNIFAMFGGHVFQQTVDIFMVADFIQGASQEKRKKASPIL